MEPLAASVLRSTNRPLPSYDLVFASNQDEFGGLQRSIRKSNGVEIQRRSLPAVGDNRGRDPVWSKTNKSGHERTRSGKAKKEKRSRSKLGMTCRNGQLVHRRQQGSP